MWVVHERERERHTHTDAVFTTGKIERKGRLKMKLLGLKLSRI